MNGNCQESSLKVRKGKKTVMIWSLKKKTKVDSDGELLLLECLPDCVVNVEGGEDDGPKAQLRFYFEGKIIMPEPEPRPPSYIMLATTKKHADRKHCYLGLHAEQLFNAGGKIKQYEIKVDRVNHHLDVLHSGGKGVENFISVVEAVKKMKVKVKERFINLAGDRDRKPISTEPRCWYLADFPDVSDLLLRISVTPIYVRAAGDAENQNEGGTEAEAEPLKVEEFFCQALKGMLAAEENYSDLKLETKDNATLSAHKFILAATSPVLRARIEREVKVNGFNGTIKLAEVNAKLMIAILHWMYTCELHENVWKFMEEVVDAAIHFELTDMIKMLDKKMIGICARGNMFQLYNTAEKNGMLTAMADVSKFIKENI